MSVGAILLSRLDSSRLPGKALVEIDGKPLIGHVIDMCREIVGIDKIILATTNRPMDDPLAEYANQLNINCFRGGLDNVAERFLGAMVEFDVEWALRINGDSPLNDPGLLSEGVRKALLNDFDLITNVQERTFPYGMSMECISRVAMVKACKAMYERSHLEHVTKFFYDNQGQFKIYNMISGKEEYIGVQLAVDTVDDLKRFTWIKEHIGDDMNPERIVEFAKKFELRVREIDE
ncbi:MAG: NTP transferase domain-containing protein [Lentisphaeraceae bacterium]|nr:NTP transferase domain-containing protein [Lentisphaeraceae bacterium]